MKQLRAARSGYMLISVFFYITGILYMVKISASPMISCMVSGAVLISYGVVKILGYLSNDLYCLAFQYDLACGLFLIVIGLIDMGCNLRIREWLLPALGLLILLDALLKIQTAKEARDFGLQTWKRILTASTAAGIFGAMIIIQPFSDPLAAHITVGCGLLAEGFMNQLTVMETVKLNEKKEKEKDFEE